MTGVEYEKFMVVLVCYQQMNHELYPGMIAVANVLHNRAAAGWFQNSLYWNAVAMFNEADKSTQLPDVRDPEFQKLLMGIDALFAGRLGDKTNGAMYFTKADTEVIAGQVTAKIGQTIFFK